MATDEWDSDGDSLSTRCCKTGIELQMSATRTRASHGSPLEAPDGPGLIHWLATDASVCDRVITDGRRTISYAELPSLLERMHHRHFAHDGATTAHPIALECSQDVAGALALLYLISRQRSAVLLPNLTARSAKEAGTPRFIPSFCADIVSTHEEGENTEGEDGLKCTANLTFTPEPVLATFRGPDFYLRTSGSTGTPKLTRMSHQRWLNNAMACVDRWSLTRDDRLMVPVPIFHSYGFGAAFLPGLLAGASMDILSEGNIVRYLNRETRFDPNIAFLTPAMCDIFLARRASPRPYRLVVTAGDKVKRETMSGFESRFGPLLNLFGSAEMGAVSAASPHDPPDTRLATAGYALAGIELRTEQASVENDAAAKEGVGRLHCRQKNGTEGYLIQEDRWRFEPHRDDEWFDMGDLARIRDDRYVEIVGRSNLSVKRDGLLVVFADVEAALEKAESVQRAVVVASGESARGSRMIGICLADPTSHRPTPDSVRKTCLELLPRYAVPDEVVIVDALPQLPSGKIDRHALRASLSGSAS
jgi:acyl-coenzyme A synthetase/AMP-(fatty) acid ligase